MRSWSAAAGAVVDNRPGLTALGEVLVRRMEPVPAEQFAGACPITVHLDGAVSVRKRTAPYKGAMFAAYPGDVVFSKIDARHGAIGLIPSSIPKAVVTPEFPVFVPAPDSLDGAFLSLLLRTGGFIDALRARATGTSGRKRITPEAFESLRIPLPPLEDQQRMAAGHADAMAAAEALEEEAARTETEALAAFEAALGLAAPAPLPDRPVFVARFRKLDRWSHEAALRGGSQAATPDTWPTAQLGDVIADLENGWSPKCLTRPANETEWGVLKLGAVSFGTFEELENKALPSQLAPRPALEVRAGEVLISRANVTRLVGAATFVEQTREHLMLCDKIFRVIPKASGDLDLRFLAQVLRTRHVRGQIESKLTGTSPTMKNISKPALMSLTFPLPPLETQKTLTGALSAARARAAELREQARQTRRSAWSDLEAEVASPAS